MRRWIAVPLFFAAAVGFTSQQLPQASAQPKAGTPTAEAFRTADGVELNGLFHPTAKNANTAPVVVFLYAPGPDRDLTKGDWASLAKVLNEAGYHVFQFDWRGHGKSTSIKDKQKFWGNPYLNGGAVTFNGYIRGGKMKNEIDIKKDVTNATRFMPAYLNDLAAVRLHLDTKNDNKEVNTSSIYIVGERDAAALGMAWLAAEWNRPAVFPNETMRGGAPTYEFVPQRLVGGIPAEGGADFGGAVWLTATRPTSFPGQVVQQWVSNQNYAPKIRENNPMLFLFAEKDNKGKNESDFYYDQVLVAEPRKGSRLEKLENTRMLEVKGAAEQKGIQLLGQNATLKTETTILQYFDFIQKQRAKIPSKARKYDTPYFINVNYFGLKP
jgi:hypothetical protein